MDTINSKEKTDNELIAEFMGKEVHYVKGLKYDSLWDWLMPVVEKIEKHGAIVELNICLATMCRIVALNGSREKIKEFLNGGSISLLDSTYLSVVDFIKWYKTQNQKAL